MRSRRDVLRLATGGVAATAGASAAFAQDGAWWERVFSDPGPRQRAASLDRSSAQQASLQDLRQNNLPWRSEEMLRLIEDAVDKYERAARERSWRIIQQGNLLRPGAFDERIPLIRSRLVVSGELSERDANAYGSSLEYDPFMDRAIRRFQSMHGLTPSGTINRSTLAQLNISPSDRLRQLRVNRDRIARLVETSIEERYVLVNAAAYQLEAVDRFEVERRHRVIVGKPDSGRQTPEITAVIEGMNFFPFWRVPQTIAVRDIIPRLRKEPEYLDQEGIVVVEDHFNGPLIDHRSIDWHTVDPTRLRFRQEPGDRNALGLVRINMPNPDIVYLHDTPMKELFGQGMRAFSAGCVRVQDVFDLAAWLARYEPGFASGRDAVDAIIEARQPVDITFTRPVPVYFSYITAWAEPDGSVVFRPDIYGRDGSDALRGERDPDAPVVETLSP
ncbi:MAG: murein L,D-transpeptidase [Hyphomicrobiaceae bacterium]